jgi:hypothetical protein
MNPDQSSPPADSHRSAFTLILADNLDDGHQRTAEFLDEELVALEVSG